VAQGRDLRNTLGSSLSGRNYFNNPINFLSPFSSKIIL